ncbi:MAG: hypothetical protein IPK75_17900 [Acidobacteria bacterium]|nr:hypothetical protein [Acidobacteriota bacterium]
MAAAGRLHGASILGAGRGSADLQRRRCAKALTPAAIGAIDGSGTAGRLAQWSDADTLAASTLIKSGAGVLTLSAAGAYTLTIPATGTAALGSGTANQIAYWTDAFTLASDTDLRFDGTRASLGTALSAVSRLIVRGTGTGSGTYAIYAENSGGTVAGYMRDDGTVYGRTLIATDGEFSSAAGNHWNFGTYIAGAPTATGYIQIIIDGVSRKLLAA